MHSAEPPAHHFLPLPAPLTLAQSFKDVPTQPGIDTAQFCDAAEGLVKIFDLFGNPAFSVVQSDLTGNIAKVRARLASHPAESVTLEDLVKNEAKEKKKTATEGLMWLLRGLKFTLLGLRRSQENEEEELAISFTKAYEGSLKPYHNFVVKGVFGVRPSSFFFLLSFLSCLAFSFRFACSEFTLVVFLTP